MSLNMGQAAIAGTAIAFAIPPGACSITVWSAAATTVYLGTGKAGLTSSNGYAVSTYPTTFAAYGSSAGATVYGLNTAATTLAVNYIVSSES
jgi:hypothetical protein